MAPNKLSLKLVIDKKNNRVVYAEAGKNVIDFLFSLLCLPIGSAVKLLTKSKMVGCFGNLYDSVENLNTTYLNSKDLLLNPKVADAPPINIPLLIPNEAEKKFYSCNSGNHHNHFTNDYTPGIRWFVRCPVCNQKMTTKLTCFPSAPASTDAIGYVKEVVSYMVMDDLTVMPMSTTAIITLLDKLRIDNVKSLEEKEVDFGKEEALELLRMPLQSENVFSQVFLVKKEK